MRTKIDNSFLQNYPLKEKHNKQHKVQIICFNFGAKIQAELTNKQTKTPIKVQNKQKKKKENKKVNTVPPKTRPNINTKLIKIP